MTLLRTDPQRTRAGRRAVPSGEEVFFNWLIRLPHDADIGEAALAQIERIDRRGAGRGELSHLRLLFMEVVRASAAGPGGRRRPRR